MYSKKIPRERNIRELYYDVAEIIDWTDDKLSSDEVYISRAIRIISRLNKFFKKTIDKTL